MKFKPILTLPLYSLSPKIFTYSSSRAILELHMRLLDKLAYVELLVTTAPHSVKPKSNCVSLPNGLISMSILWTLAKSNKYEVDLYNIWALVSSSVDEPSVWKLFVTRLGQNSILKLINKSEQKIGTNLSNEPKSNTLMFKL